VLELNAPEDTVTEPLDGHDRSQRSAARFGYGIAFGSGGAETNGPVMVGMSSVMIVSICNMVISPYWLRLVMVQLST